MTRLHHSQTPLTSGKTPSDAVPTTGAVLWFNRSHTLVQDTYTAQTPRLIPSSTHIETARRTLRAELLGFIKSLRTCTAERKRRVVRSHGQHWSIGERYIARHQIPHEQARAGQYEPPDLLDNYTRTPGITTHIKNQINMELPQTRRQTQAHSRKQSHGHWQTWMFTSNTQKKNVALTETNFLHATLSIRSSHAIHEAREGTIVETVIGQRANTSQSQHLRRHCPPPQKSPTYAWCWLTGAWNIRLATEKCKFEDSNRILVTVAWT